MEITTKSEADKLAWQFFGRPLPMTHDEMKSAFRAACKRLHPDVTEWPMVYAEELFKQMNGFYQSLQNKSWAFSDAIAVAKTTGGELLTELGLGLGPLKNGRDCEDCHHKGYTEHIPEGWVRCAWCDFGWSYTQPCQRCQGTGNGPKQKPHACPQCKGEGVFHYARAVKCKECSGLGGKTVKAGTVLYEVCWTCKGTGEIEIFNPVIPKGWLAK